MTGGGGVAVAPTDPFATWRDLQQRADGPAPAAPATAPSGTDLPEAPAAELDALDDLDHPRLVLSEGYVGVDRRRTGWAAALARLTFDPRHRLLRLEALIAVAVVVGAVLLVSAGPSPAPLASRAGTSLALPSKALAGLEPAAARTPTTTAATPPATAAAAAPAATVPTTVPPAPVAAAPPATAPPSTPDAMGAAALALVRYPWQQIPGYSIRFLPIADAPSPGFYGNTDFTWGQKGGVSTLYVYPGETVQQLAGITAFEIGHEVDAGYVEPAGGHAAVSAILGIDPPSWAPECDCAEQGYLSGWYAAAFSDYWSPGVGAWSTLAPPPSGATLTAMERWLDPSLS